MVAKRETSGSTQRRRPRRTIASKSRSRARAATATTAKLTTTTAEKEIEYKMIEKKAYCQIGLWCTLDNAVCGFDKFSRGAFRSRA